MNPLIADARSPVPLGRVLTCRWCGQEHRLPELRPGERAMCVRCDGLLAKRGRFGGGSLAFSIAGLALAIPAMMFPLVTVDRLRSERVAFLFGGTEALWDHGMRLLAIWVVLCAAIAPIALLATLSGWLLHVRRGAGAVPKLFSQLATVAEEWAMPEVYVLAVLVALTKLGTLVNVSVGPGLWFYAGMSVMLLLAWRSFEYGLPPAERIATTRPS
jgi:paraquat-inducible protein A